MQRYHERGTEEDEGGGRVGDPETGVSCAEARWADRAGAGTEEGRGRGRAAIRDDPDPACAAETDIGGRRGVITFRVGKVVPYMYLWERFVIGGCVYTRKSSSSMKKTSNVKRIYALATRSQSRRCLQSGEDSRSWSTG
jgi:hypothetical protein